MGRYEYAAGVPVSLQWSYVLKPGCKAGNYATGNDSDLTIDSHINYTNYK
jgi:hypothetical protein